jgi:hypothetical protein
VANGKFETSAGRKKERADLLIVYVDGQPITDIEVADIFGTDPGQQQKQFAVDTRAICAALEGIVKKRPQSRLNIILLRKADKEKKQVVLAESPTVQEVLDAARLWQKGAANVPDVTVPIPGPKGQKGIEGRPNAPYPDQVVRLLAEEWVTLGMRSNKVEGVGLSQVLDFMLRKQGKWESTARQMLHLALHRTCPLFLGVFGALHANDLQRWQAYRPESRETTLRAVSVLGILLHSLGRRKETYVSDTAFLIGQLLSRADTLHREYCRLVRNGSIPPQLIGNGLMPVAADNPADAVDRLRERINVYKAWADQGRGEEHALAKWAVGEIGRVCQLLPRPLPSRTDQAFRAELFLGYMARTPAKGGSRDNTNDKSPNNEGERT